MKRGLYSLFFKRFFDIIISLLSIIILSPVFLIVYLMSLVILRGNPIFKQYRPGKNGKIFGLYKFRSMTNKKDKDGNLLPDAERMTKWGTLLRKTSIDELPQLFNILGGSMSLIGPRPRMVEECVFLNDDQLDRFAARPGVTGWAQVNGRNSLTLDQIVEYDKYYIEHLTFWFDVKIFFKTIGYILGKGKKDINKAGTVSNEFHGDYLLRTGKITKEEYDEKISLAKEMIKNRNDKTKSKDETKLED